MSDILIRTFKDITIDHIDKSISFYCWITNIRIQKTISFLIFQNDHLELQGIIKENKELLSYSKNLSLGSYIKVIGTLLNRFSSNIRKDSFLNSVEITIHNLITINEFNKDEININPNDLNKSSDLLRNKYRYLDLRSNISYENIIFRSKVLLYIRNYLDSDNFIEISTPIITAINLEGSDSYLVISKKFKNMMYCLSQSPQLYKQMLMSSDVSKYYQLAPCFRDETSRKNRLPTEFYQLDIEIAHVRDINYVIKLIDKLLYDLIRKYSIYKEIKYKLFTFEEAVSIYGNENIDLRIIDKYNLKVEEESIVIEDVDDIYNKLISKFGKTNNIYLHDKNIYLNRSNDNLKEIYNFISNCCESLNYISYCWVIDFPMFEYNEEGNLSFGHHPFSDVYNKDETDIMKIKSKQYDLIINGDEVGGGSIRNSDYDSLIYLLQKVVNKTEDELTKAFSGFLEMFKFGIPYHAGIAIGIERLLSKLKNIDKIREFVAFPFNQNGSDDLLGSPKKLSKNDLKKYIS